MEFETHFSLQSCHLFFFHSYIVANLLHPSNKKLNKICMTFFLMFWLIHVDSIYFLLALIRFSCSSFRLYF